MTQKIVRPVRAWHTETVRITWGCDDGSIYEQDVTIPPADVRKARTSLLRCEGRYPVPGPRDEPFDVTYRCARALGHEGPHGP